MKKLLFLAAALTSLTFATTACSDNKGKTETTTAASPAATTDTTTTPGNPGPGIAAATYTCPMHPEVITNEPGECPKCGMALVKK